MKDQPIRQARLQVSSDAFWNWLADETQTNLHDLEVKSILETPDGVEFIVVHTAGKDTT